MTLRWGTDLIPKPEYQFVVYYDWIVRNEKSIFDP